MRRDKRDSGTDPVAREVARHLTAELDPKNMRFSRKRGEGKS